MISDQSKIFRWTIRRDRFIDWSDISSVFRWRIFIKFLHRLFNCFFHSTFQSSNFFSMLKENKGGHCFNFVFRCFTLERKWRKISIDRRIIEHYGAFFDISFEKNGVGILRTQLFNEWSDVFTWTTPKRCFLSNINEESVFSVDRTKWQKNPQEPIYHRLLSVLHWDYHWKFLSQAFQCSMWNDDEEEIFNLKRREISEGFSLLPVQRKEKKRRRELKLEETKTNIEWQWRKQKMSRNDQQHSSIRENKDTVAKKWNLTWRC